MKKEYVSLEDVISDISALRVNILYSPEIEDIIETDPEAGQLFLLAITDLSSAYHKMKLTKLKIDKI